MAGTPQDAGPGAARGGKREAGLGGGLVLLVGAMAAGLGVLVGAQVASRAVPGVVAQEASPSVLGLGARGAGRAVPGVVARVRGVRTPVAGAVLRGAGSLGRGRGAADRVLAGSPVATGRLAVMGLGLGIGDQKAAQAQAGRQAGHLEGDRPGRAAPGTWRRRGKAAGRPVSGRQAPGVHRVAGNWAVGHRGRGVVVTGTWRETTAGRRVRADRVPGHSVMRTWPEAIVEQWVGADRGHGVVEMPA